MAGARKARQPSCQKTADVQQSGSLPEELRGKWDELNLSAQILDSATDSISVVDLEGNIIYVNERTCRFLGYSRDELIGKNIRKLVSPEFAALIETRTKEILEKGEATFETAQIRKDGSLVPLELHARVIEYGGRKMILDVGRDIAERKKLEEELKLKAMLLDGATDGIVLRDFDGNIVYANETAARLRGYTRDELMKMNIKQLIAPGYPMVSGERLQQLLEKGEVIYETADLCKDGTLIPVEAHPRLIEWGGRKMVFTVVRDITEHKKAEEELKLRSEILDSATDLIFMRDVHGHIVYINKVAIESLGYSKEELMSMNIRQLLVPDEARHVESRTREILKGGNYVFESSQVRKDGSIIPMEVHARAIEVGGKQFILAVCRDITRRKKAEEELRLKSQLLDGATDLIYLRDLDGNYLYMNETASKHLGYTREELLTMTVQQLVPHGYPTFTELPQQELEQKGKVVFETYLTREDGSLIPVEVHAQFIEVGDRKLISGIARDITERKKMEEIVKQLAYYDTLTNLPNRALFTERFNPALAQAIRYKHRLALLMMDLDKFKEVNDTLGHEAGDDLLKQVGTRLSALVRKTDTVSRRGGDEFVLLLTEVHQVEDATNVAQKIIEAVLKPFMLCGRRRSITTSVGIAIYPDDGQDIDTLLKHADDAMYQVKQTGRNGYMRYTPSL